MDVTTLTGPAAEPVSLSEAKAHLRVDFADDDARISGMIADVRAEVEDFTRLRLITQTVRVTLAGFPARLALPVWPVQAVTAVAYDDAAGDAETLDAGLWRLRDDRKPREIAMRAGAAWPSVSEDGGVRIDVRCGFGDTGAAVPGAIRSAILLILGARYMQREDATVGVAASALPDMLGARALLMRHVFYP